MSALVNRQLILRHRPIGDVGPEHFEMVTKPVPDFRNDEALVKVFWLGIDPTQRTWLNCRANCENSRLSSHRFSRQPREMRMGDAKGTI